MNKVYAISIVYITSANVTVHIFVLLTYHVPFHKRYCAVSKLTSKVDRTKLSKLSIIDETLSRSTLDCLLKLLAPAG